MGGSGGGSCIHSITASPFCHCPLKEKHLCMQNCTNCVCVFFSFLSPRRLCACFGGWWGGGGGGGGVEGRLSYSFECK